MKYSLLFVLLFGWTFSLSESKAISSEITQGDPVAKIVRSIAKADVYETRAYTASHKNTLQQNQNKINLAKVASIEKLTQLVLRHKRAIVRLYAFEALVQKQKNIPKEIIEHVKNDDGMITVFDGNTTVKKPLNAIAAGFLY
ncbi:MAG: hypothetical protein ABIP35_10910 [Ginsengibacter sp.]